MSQINVFRIFETLNGILTFFQTVKMFCLFRDLYNWETSRAQAISTFQANRNQMHNTTVNTVAKVLHLV